MQETTSMQETPSMQEMEVWFLGQEDSPGEGNSNPVLIFLLGKSHGQRRLVESDMT